MHFRPNPRPSKSKTLVWGPEICFKEFFRWFWCRLKIGNPALHWAAFCGALKLEVTFKGWRGCVAHWLEAPRSSENQFPPLTALLTDHLIHLIRPSIVHCLSIAQQVLLFVPLTTHRTGKKNSFILACGQEEDQVLSFAIPDQTGFPNTAILNEFQFSVFPLLPAGSVCSYL